MSELKESRCGSSPFERKMWLMLVRLLLSVVEFSKLILFALHSPGSIDLFSIGVVTSFCVSVDLRAISAEGLTLSRVRDESLWLLAEDNCDTLTSSLGW
jgi:hypothetical protein